MNTKLFTSFCNYHLHTATHDTRPNLFNFYFDVQNVNNEFAIQVIMSFATKYKMTHKIKTSPVKRTKDFTPSLKNAQYQVVMMKVQNH